MRYAVALLLVLSATLAVAEPVAADSGQRMIVPTPSAYRDGGDVVVRGRVSGRATTVRIQKKIAGTWVTARKVAVRSGFYSSRFPATPTTSTSLRAVAKTTISRTVVVARAVPVTDACGTLLPKADGSTWSCTFVDGFDGSTLDRAKWMPQTIFGSGVPSARACYLDDPSVINVANGTLNLSVRQVSTPVSCTFGGMSGPTDYVAGSVMTYRLFAQQYGRFEARIKNTATTYQGLHEAFWLWPDDRYESTALWPAAGEIDIVETYSHYPHHAIPFLHYGTGGGPVPTVNTAWDCIAQRGEWNTYTLEWTATKIQIFVNGKSCLVNTSGDPAFQKPYIMALTQALGAAGNEYDGRAPIPATMNVDYVKVWK